MFHVKHRLHRVSQDSESCPAAGVPSDGPER